MRADQFEPPINHIRNGTAEHPGADQPAHTNQYHNHRHGFGQLGDDGINDVVPAIALPVGQRSGNAGGSQQQRFDPQTQLAIAYDKQQQHGHNGEHR
ncbi:hypothetical protein D3C71_1636890 [compost metagenome]